MQNHIVIMAGGIGSRFWPMSTSEYPKQFIDVMGVGKSLIQLTVERFKDICPKENFWVVTSEKYVDIVKEQLPQIPAQHILAEPEARNTAPCIAYACWKIRKEFPQANIVVTPSDALVIDTASSDGVTWVAGVRCAPCCRRMKRAMPRWAAGWICTTAGTVWCMRRSTDRWCWRVWRATS